MDEPDQPYSNIREILGWAIGQRIVEITQHDQDEFEEEGAFVMLMFESGGYIRFPVDEAGFVQDDGIPEPEPPASE